MLRPQFMTIDSRRRRLSPQVARPSPGWLPLAMLLLLGTLWGASFSISKIAIQAGVTPLGYAFWQSFGPRRRCSF